MEHLKIFPDSITWKENQIGIFEYYIGPDTSNPQPFDISMCTTDEDFENGEFEPEEKQDVLNNLPGIVNELEGLGYKLTWGEEETAEGGEDGLDDEEDEDGRGIVNPDSPSPNTPNSGKQIYLLYFGTETGNREDCSIFYEVPEVWEKKKDAVAREKTLNAANKGKDEFYTHLVPVNIE